MSGLGTGHVFKETEELKKFKKCLQTYAGFTEYVCIEFKKKRKIAFRPKNYSSEDSAWPTRGCCTSVYYNDITHMHVFDLLLLDWTWVLNLLSELIKATETHMRVLCRCYHFSQLKCCSQKWDKLMFLCPLFSFNRYQSWIEQLHTCCSRGAPLVSQQ